jgi:putative membrane protein
MPYCGSAPAPGDWLTRWNFDLPLLLGLLAIGLSIWRLCSTRNQQAHAAAALALAVLLFVSPFCAFTSALFSARVTHHLLLTAAIAPLLVMAIPFERFRLAGSLTFWTTVQALTFWLWHAPGVYSQALSSNAVYWAMQLSLLGTALGFWAVLRRASAPAAVAALLATTVQMGLLGALITFAGVPLYVPHLLVTEAWGFTPLQDQQLAGLIMWVPAAGLYLGAALVLAHRWLTREEGRLAS